MDELSFHQAQQVQHFTQQYASYSARKSGLGNVLGGLVGITIYLLNGLPGHSFWSTLLTIGLTLAWLGGKEILRRYVYQRFGRVRENLSSSTRTLHSWILGISIPTTLGLWLLAWIVFLNPALHLGLVRLLLALLCASSIPWLSLRFLRTLDEFMVGFFLLLCCAISSLGSTLMPPGIEGWLGTFWVPLYSLILITRGLTEHQAFRSLAHTLQHRKDNYQ
jgi:hypothetical protein